MTALSKPLRRTLGTLRWLNLASQPQGLFLFYTGSQINPTLLHQSFLAYGAQGLTTFFFGHSWANSFWPRYHPALAFLSRGAFWAFYWPSLALWQKAQAQFSFLSQPFCGLAAGHFFFHPEALSEAQRCGPSLLCGTLDAVWRPLVDSLFLLTASLVASLPS